MMHKPIHIHDLTLSFPHKLCFEQFSTSIFPGDRIALIGKNGSGKSTLLTFLSGYALPTQGTIILPPGIRIGYIPQIHPETPATLSGGQLFNKALTQALALDPVVLLLDEPTNHLDSFNRASLIRMLQNYRGTLIIASHDATLLSGTVSSFWTLENGRIALFHGTYDACMREKNNQRAALEHKLSQLKSQKEEMHLRLMQEQARATKSRSYGQQQKNQKRWSPMTAADKACQAQQTAGRRSHSISQEKEEIIAALQKLRPSSPLIPRFGILSDQHKNQMLVSISDGSVGYTTPLLEGITFSVMSGERVGITGANGSGKSTFIKALLQDSTILKSGRWHTPPPHSIGYLDQQYATLPYNHTVLHALKEQVPHWSDREARTHLNSFLFSKNEEVTALVSTLSGGERARLSLALIAARPPKLLILDEISNNLDKETLEHVITVLQHYPGALIIVTHHEELLHTLTITKHYRCKEKMLFLVE